MWAERTRRPMQLICSAGWWQYDERTSRDLESAFGRGHRVFELLVAGFLYSVDFDRMVQQRRNDPSRRRRIKRDLSSIPKKGVAGIKTEEGLEEGFGAAPGAAGPPSAATVSTPTPSQELLLQRPPAPPPASEGSLGGISDQLRDLALHQEETEFYSIDGTEEYDLPNDNEGL